MSVTDRIKREILAFNVKRVNAKKKKSLQNTDFTLLCNNCTGGVLLHDFGVKFNTPTINVSIRPDSFLRFCKNLPYYLSLEVEEAKTEYSYPVGRLDDVEIHFMHASDFAAGKAEWDKRKGRVNLKNLFVVLVAYEDQMTYEEMCDAAQIPYRKILFVNQPHPELPYAHYLPGFEEKAGLGHIWQPKGLSGRKYYDEFDFAAWFNQGEEG